MEPNNAILKTKTWGRSLVETGRDWAGDARVELDVPLRVEVLLIRVALQDVTQLHDAFLRGAASAVKMTTILSDPSQR